MDLKGYFFNSKLVDGVQDRKYNAEDFCSYLEKIVGNGVFSNPSTNLQVTEMANSPSMQVRVRPGQAWIKGHKVILDENIYFDIMVESISLYRKDRIVLACDFKERNFKIYVKEGETASSKDSAVAPTLIRNDNIYELGLAIINTGNGAIKITNADITDTRGIVDDCGFVSVLINQVDTTTLFQQYESQMAQMQEELRVGFDEWFDNLTTTLVSNTVFTERKAIYKTSRANEQTITIPESLLYGDALDILHVFINGIRLVEGIEYTKTDTTITFTYPLAQLGTVIEITNWKTAGSSKVQEIVSNVLTLEEDMNNIKKYRYVCTGIDDNIKIMNIINDFLGVKGNYTGGTAYDQMQLQIVGSINPVNFSTMTVDSRISLFGSKVTSARKVVLDFSNAGIEILGSNIANLGLDSIFDLASNVTIKNLSMNLVLPTGSISANEFAVIRTSGDVIGGNINITNNTISSVTGVTATNTGLQMIEDVKVSLLSTSTTSVSSAQRGFLSRTEYSDVAEDVKFVKCKASVQTNANTNYKTYGFQGVGNFDNCVVYIYNRGTVEYSDAVGFFNENKSSLTNCQCYVTGSRFVRGFEGNGSYVNCKAHAASNGAFACQGFFITGSATNCEGIGRNASNGGSGYGFFLKDNTATLKLVNCTGYGYKSAYATADSTFAYGIAANGTATTQTLICIGCQVPKIDRTNFVQQGSILLRGTDSGANASLVGNILYTAITKHSGSNVTETGNII